MVKGHLQRLKTTCRQLAGVQEGAAPPCAERRGGGNGGPLMANWQLEWARVHLLRVTHQKPLAVSLSP